MQTIAAKELLKAHEAIELGDFGIVFAEAEKDLVLADGETFLSAGSRYASTIRAAYNRVEGLTESLALLAAKDPSSNVEEGIFQCMENGYRTGLLIGLGGVGIHG